MVLVFVEHAHGELDELSLQALTFARGYAGGEPVDAVVAGAGAAEAAGALGAHGVATVHVAEHDSPTGTPRRPGPARSRSSPSGSPPPL